MSEQSNGGWPDASKPGVPMHAERDGWHWVLAGSWDQPIALQWCAQLQFWFSRPHRLEEAHYLGPCLTPAEVAALLAAKERAEAERDALAKVNAGCGDAYRVTLAQLDAARAEAAKMRQPDFWALADDGEVSVSDPSEFWANGNVDDDQVVKIIGFRSVETVWAVNVPTAWSDGEPSDWEVRCFPSEEEARAALAQEPGHE